MLTKHETDTEARVMSNSFGTCIKSSWSRTARSECAPQIFTFIGVVTPWFALGLLSFVMGLARTSLAQCTFRPRGYRCRRKPLEHDGDVHSITSTMAQGYHAASRMILQRRSTLLASGTRLFPNRFPFLNDCSHARTL